MHFEARLGDMGTFAHLTEWRQEFHPFFSHINTGISLSIRHLELFFFSIVLPFARGLHLACGLFFVPGTLGVHQAWSILYFQAHLEIKFIAHLCNTSNPAVPTPCAVHLPHRFSKFHYHSQAASFKSPCYATCSPMIGSDIFIEISSSGWDVALCSCVNHLKLSDVHSPLVDTFLSAQSIQVCVYIYVAC